MAAIPNFCTAITLITLSFTRDICALTVNWTSTPPTYTIQPEILPRKTRAMAVGYDADNQTILLFGGFDSILQKQFIKFSITQNTFIDEGTAYLSQGTYSYAQHYTQLDNHLWMLRGAHFIDFDIATYTAYYPNITVPIDIRLAGCLTSSQNHLIVVGGGDQRSSTTGNMSYYLNTTQMYSITNAHWLQNLPTMTQARSAASCIVVNDKLYAIGGTNQYKTDTVEKLNVANINDATWIQSQSWELISGALNFPITRTRVVAHGQYIIQIGGLIQSGWNIMPYVNVIDTQTGTAQFMNNLPFRNVLSAPIIVNDVLHIFGGYTRDESGWYSVDTHIVSYLPPVETKAPTDNPTAATMTPSTNPTEAPSDHPSATTTVPSTQPTVHPISVPTRSTALQTLTALQPTIEQLSTSSMASHLPSGTPMLSRKQDPLLIVYVASGSVSLVLVLTAVVFCFWGYQEKIQKIDKHISANISNHDVHVSSAINLQHDNIQMNTSDEDIYDVTPHEIEGDVVRINCNNDDEMYTQAGQQNEGRDEDNGAPTNRGSVMHISDDVITAGNDVNEEQKEDVILDAMLSDILEMQNLDPNKIHQINLNNAVDQANDIDRDNSDSDESDKIYQH
eukprot:114468_1